MKSIRTLAAGLAFVAVALVLGCNKPDGTAPKGSTKNEPKGKEEHTHGKGPHGGAVGDWGGGKYHIEFTVDHPKKEARVYILGSNQKSPVPISAKDGQISLSITGLKTKETFQVTLKADPQKGDPEGKASCFVGTDDKLGIEQEFEGTVSGEANGTPYTGKFKEEPELPKK
ncbi:MAG: hypothetical protein K2R98_13355 [Gemmataceae bacterium]|nr:hypothetical protein [Gemmataceae bacterium]